MKVEVLKNKTKTPVLRDQNQYFENTVYRRLKNSKPGYNWRKIAHKIFKLCVSTE